MVGPRGRAPRAGPSPAAAPGAVWAYAAVRDVDGDADWVVLLLAGDTPAWAVSVDGDLPATGLVTAAAPVLAGACVALAQNDRVLDVVGQVRPVGTGDVRAIVRKAADHPG